MIVFLKWKLSHNDRSLFTWWLGPFEDDFLFRKCITGSVEKVRKCVTVFFAKFGASRLECFWCTSSVQFDVQSLLVCSYYLDGLNMCVTFVTGFSFLRASPSNHLYLILLPPKPFMCAKNVVYIGLVLGWYNLYDVSFKNILEYHVWLSIIFCVFK